MKPTILPQFRRLGTLPSAYLIYHKRLQFAIFNFYFIEICLKLDAESLANTFK